LQKEKALDNNSDLLVSKNIKNNYKMTVSMQIPVFNHGGQQLQDSFTKSNQEHFSSAELTASSLSPKKSLKSGLSSSCLHSLHLAGGLQDNMKYKKHGYNYSLCL